MKPQQYTPGSFIALLVAAMNAGHPYSEREPAGLSALVNPGPGAVQPVAAPGPVNQTSSKEKQ